MSAVEVTLPNSYVDLLTQDPESKRSRALAHGTYAKKAIIAFFQDFYSSPDNSDGKYIFAPEGASPGGNQLRIVPPYQFNQTAADSRPALVIARRGTRRIEQTMTKGLRQQNIMTGTESRQCTRAMSFSVTAVASRGEEAEDLAERTLDAIDIFDDEFRSILGWQSITAVEMSGQNPMIIDSRPEMMSVVVSVNGIMRARYRKIGKSRRLSYLVEEVDITSIPLE